MEHLPAEVQKDFMNGSHVMRHQHVIWNGIWSDMFIESTFMRYGHGPGGIIGITLKPSALNRWALSLHTCSQLMKDVSSISDTAHQKVVITHKEELLQRVRADNVDREKLRAKIHTVINPLDSNEHMDCIINVVTGKVAQDNVNVDKSVEIGLQQMNDFESSWPVGFHSSISKKVVTMSTMRRHIKIGNSQLYDTDLIYSRVIGLRTSRNMSMKEVLKFELSPIPTSLYEDSGDMRLAKAKSVLKKKLQIDQSDRTFSKPETIIIDGCALLWVIHWPTNGTVIHFANNVVQYLKKRMSLADVYLVFDRYYVSSIKRILRSMRAGVSASRKHILNDQSPLPPQKVVLNVTENKSQIIKLVCQHLRKQCNTFPADKKLVVTEQEPVPFEINKGVIIQRSDMRTTYEEADVIIIQQLLSVVELAVKSVKIICDVTDVFVLLVHYYITENLTSELIMCGTSASRSVTYVKATAIKHASIANQLLPAHALSSCDTVSQLYGIGKGTVLKVVNSNVKRDTLGQTTEDVDTILRDAKKIIAC